MPYDTSIDEILTDSFRKVMGRCPVADGPGEPRPVRFVTHAERLKERRKTAVEMHEGGASPKEIAFSLGVSYSMVLRDLKMSGVVLQGARNEAQRQMAQDMRNQGTSVKDIAKKMNVSPSRIYQITRTPEKASA